MLVVCLDRHHLATLPCFMLTACVFLHFCRRTTVFSRQMLVFVCFRSVYTILEPAPGSDGKECMVLTTTQDLSRGAKDMLGQPAFTGLSLSLSVLKHLKHRVGWMSKRLIVLIADEDIDGAEGLDLGVKTFVDDYHADTLDILER